MKITENQIQKLYKFTRKHYVYHYDVQTELVDHLANDIEEIWEENPNLTFEEARDKSFKKFGIFGFMDVVEQKQKQMSKRYWKIIWRFMKEWFTIPKIVVTLLIFFSLLAIIKIPYSSYAVVGVLFVATIFESYKSYQHRKKQNQKEKKKEKIFLLEAMIGQSKNGYTGLMFINLFNFFNITNFQTHSLTIEWQVVISIFVTLLTILFYIVNYILPQKAEELLQETYPEYKMVKNL